MRCLAPTSQTCCAWPRLTNRASLASWPTTPPEPATTYIARPCLPGLPVATQPERAMPAAPHLTSPCNARTRLASHTTPARATLALPASPRHTGPLHACRPLRCLDRSWPRHSVPANPAVQRHPFHACYPGPAITALPHLPTTPVLTLSFTTTTADPSLIQPLPASPADPGLQHLAMPATIALPAMPPWPRPRGLACRALP